MNISPRDRIIAWLTMWAEARSEGPQGLEAVAWVILHRAANPRWWGRAGVASVCLAPRQFSCWNADDPQRARMLAMIEAGGLDAPVLSPAGVIWTEPMRQAFDRVERGLVPDPTNGSTHYLTRAAYASHQRAGNGWSRNREPDAAIGAHLFFRPETLGEAPITPWRPSAAPVAAPEPAPRPQPSPWAALWAAILALFRRTA